MGRRASTEPGRAPRPVRPAQGWLGLAAQVLERAGPDLPADRVLREVLARGLGLEAALRREVAVGVQAYYRWYGWLDPLKGREAGLLAARELAERFARQPDSFPAAELRKRAVPWWVWGEVSTDHAWCRFLQRPPVLWLRARRGRRDELMRELGHCVEGPTGLAEACRYSGQEDLFMTPAFREGRLEIQDLSSQLVGEICAPRAGQHWWDVCAGEGGKTMHLAELLAGRGVVWATDRAAWRLDRLRRRAARAGVFNYQAFLWDAAEVPPLRRPVDGVLVDAPCSGLGTWQRNPQARWALRPEEIGELVTRQRALLRLAASQVKPGGRLVYSVCTLTRRETVEVADAFEREEAAFEPLAVAHPLRPGAPSARVVLAPWAEGGNGMFVAVWRRRKTAESGARKE